MIKNIGNHNWPVLEHNFGLAQCAGQRSGEIFFKLFPQKLYTLMATKVKTLIEKLQLLIQN